VYGLRPYPVYLFISGAFGLFFMLYATIASVYRIKTVGLDPLQLVGTALELAILIFEVSTGVLADTHCRRRSVIVGFLLIGRASRSRGRCRSSPRS
jgi:MFS transporter, DHA3 family, tetracycline resistance protein